MRGGVVREMGMSGTAPSGEGMQKKTDESTTSAGW